VKVLIVTSSPNKDGLTAACGEQARLGAVESGVEASVVSLNELNVGKCQACKNGWGSCLEKNICQINDDFQNMHAALKDAGAVIIVTPVYWGDMSESAKAFLDRVRRCEGLKKENQFLKGKPVICVAAAGGTGNGIISCLGTMERFVDHVKGTKYDFIGVTRKNTAYKLETIYAAAKSMGCSLT